ncbi:FtsX-like permease family protein [Cellulomonas pakistanensis]|uniref:ABC3 transporter permease C-terminal domain-containing protein n=1 Tax=Cellulomonas pakistanensis TaxID=992287 RepID=A0A919U2C9_9CELL|nr:FtsX-like permease family protein [Cellulomonas pakistanensis]GIG35006.1 hypothetical protein Cpa01nite_03870 [Cellulomonas pakistanensis]
MTGRHRTRAGRRRAGVDLATLPRRSAAQAGPLALVAVLVALVVALAAVVPRAVARVSDDAVRTAVARAGAAGDLVLTTTTAFTETGRGYDGVAEVSRDAAADVATGLDARLGAVLRPPVVSTATSPLALAVGAAAGAPRGETDLRLVWTPAEGAVAWVSGGEPQFPPAPDLDGDAGDLVLLPAEPGPVAPVQVALSEPVARAVGASTGDALHLAAADGSPVEAMVSGVFRPLDPGASAWHDAPDLLEPRVSRVGPATSTLAAALLSDASLAAAVEAVGPRDVRRTVRVPFAPAGFGAADAGRVLAELPRLQASPGTIGWGAQGGSLHSGAVGVLRGAVAELASARAAATALAVGGVAVGALLLVLTAGLLAQRRTGELAARRTRGATLPALAAELGTEAVLVVGAGVVAGLLLAGAVVPGPVPVAAVLAVAGVAVLALPLAAVRRARGAVDPGGARARGAAGVRGGLRDVGARRVAAEVALVALAAGAVVALRAGGGAGAAGVGGGGAAGEAGGGAAAAAGARAGLADAAAAPDLLGAAAPALLAGVGAVLAARLLPALVRRLGPLAERSRRAVPVLAVARARSDGLAPLPLLAVATAAALVVVAASSAAAVRDGQETASWVAVGGDARVTGEPDPALGAAARSWADAPGVTAAVAARVVRDVPGRTTDGAVRVDLVAGDPAELAALARALPPGVAVPAQPDAPAGEVELRWDGADRTVRALAGVAVPPPSGGQGDARPVVVVDAAELGGAEAAAPTTVWLVGPGAGAAVDGAPPPGLAEVTTRAAVLAELRSDVLPRALVGAAAGSVALLLAFVVLAVLVAAAAGGPGRGRALDTLRTVGLTDREARRVAAGELAPAALLATAAGAALGCAVTPVVLGPLGLGGAPGAGTGSIAWAAVPAPVVAGLAAAAVVLLAEHARRRTHRLGEVLRAAG